MGDCVILFSAVMPSNPVGAPIVAVVGVHGAAKSGSIKIYSARQILEDLTETCDAVMEFALDSNGFSVLVKSDVLDPAFIGCHNHFGGLSTKELFYFLERLKLLRNYEGGIVEGFDSNPSLKDKIVELLKIG